MQAVRFRNTLLLLLAALGALSPQPAHAQDRRSLTKSELVRLLSSGVYTQAELAGLVRRSCLSFAPTAGDLSDLRSLGASGEVSSAVRWCTLPLEMDIEPAELTLRTGQSATVTFRATRAASPMPGVRLEVAGRDGLRQRGGSGPSGITDDSGVARISLSAGGAARVYRLPARANGAEPPGDPAITLRVLPGPARRARLDPPEIFLEAGSEAAASVRATLDDGYGNPVGGVAVRLTDPATGADLTSVRTDGDGAAALQVELNWVGSGVLELRAGERVLAELPVHVQAPRAEAGDAEEGADPPEDEQPADPSAPGRAVDSLTAARAAADRGDIEAAISRYRAAIDDAPRAIDLRLELARLLDRTGHVREAKSVYREVLVRAPGHLAASRAVDRLERESGRFQVSVLGGARLEGSLGLRSAEAAVRPLRSVRVWARYDLSLAIDRLPLVRGPGEVRGYFGGTAISWGRDRLLTTSLEVGRRDDDVEDAAGNPVRLRQNTVHLEQSVLVAAGRGHAQLSAGGYLGRWYDRDDWIAYLRAWVPVGDGVWIGPAIYTGETVGSDATARVTRRETRLELPVRLRTGTGWVLEPGAAIGWVRDARADAPSSRLYEARLLADVPLTETVGLRIFLRHQSAPDNDSFTLATAGIRLRID